MATRIISTKIKIDGEAEFNNQMKNVNSELSTLKTEMSLTEAAFRGQANSVEALTAKDAILRKEIEEQTKKVIASEEMIRQAEKAHSDMADAIEKVKQKASESGISIDRLRGNTKGLTEEEQKLAQKLADAESAYDKTGRIINDYQQKTNRAKTELIKLNDQLDDNSRYLDEAKRSSDNTSKSIDEFGKKVKDAGDKLDDAGGGMKDFVGLLDEMKGMLVGGAVVAGVKDLAGAVMEIEESTREYRQILGTLETSGQAAGYAAEETTAAYDRLYGILGDTQSTATTVANLQAIGLEQETLMQLIDQVTGVWATYGDSIPIDGLAESVNETIKAQQVTGTFADVLNWGTKEGETFGITMRESTEDNKEWNDAVADCKSAEDYFNLALQQCSSDSERANLVMQAMASQGLAQTSEAWRQNNEDIVAMNEAQAKWDEAMAGLGETVAPAAEAMKSFGADAIVWVTKKIQGAVEWINKAIDAYKSLTSWLNKDSDARLQAGVAAYNARVDGSHASGLARVPYDGYIAELHRDERILTAAESKVWDSIQRGDTSAGSNISVQDLRDVMAASVNAMGAIGQGGSYKVDVHMDIDGKEFYRTTIDDLRAVQKSTPEARDDR